MKDSSDFVHQVTVIIQENLNNPNLKGDLIAQALGMSRMHLHRKLKEEQRQHARDYIIQIRMNQAKELLLSTTLSVATIATQCGYKDYRYFSKVFKSNTGYTPTAYRNN